MTVYYCNKEIYSFAGDKTQQIADFLAAGWGCVRKKDVMSLFRISKIDYANTIRYMAANHYTVVEKDDFVYVSFYDGYQPNKAYMNTLTALTSIAQKQQQHNIVIVDEPYSNLFLAKMFINNDVTEELRTYYVLDTAQVPLPFYALKDVLTAEIADNGFQKTNRIIMIVYEDTDVEYIDLPCSLFYALLAHGSQGVFVEFYDNQQLKDA